MSSLRVDPSEGVAVANNGHDKFRDADRVAYSDLC